MIHWQSLTDFLAMGGYAGYVWGSFGVTALILLIEPTFVARRRRITITLLKRRLRTETRSASKAIPESPTQ